MLAEEIEFRRHMTRLAEQRRELPPDRLSLIIIVSRTPMAAASYT
ncbi:MAG: hypothetical protein WCF47_08680 [Pseudolabrys sp.]